IRRAVAFRPAIAHPSDARFRARVVDAQGAAFVCDVPVRGLIPLELADGREFFAVGDQLLLARAPVLLRLPDVPLPARVELLRPDAQRVAVLELTEGGVTVLSD
ncbi:MAG: hypothetical protein KDD82_24145, partial [Planctomycetes bacterium]|nr:hypothetical protein [Planctomycetota bacterium]